jgi:hypothetical protein
MLSAAAVNVTKSVLSVGGHGSLRGKGLHSIRYKMLGNSFAIPVIRWIGRRIQHAMRESLRVAA